jgi:cysteinyl-tRNA synthetase
MVLSKHYRTEGNFTWEILKAAQNRLNKWQAFADLLHQPKDIVEAEWLHMREQAGYRLLAWREPQMFIKQQLQDDLNTPEAIMWLDRLSDEIQVLPDNKRFLRCFREFLEFADNIFGFRLSNRNDITDKQKDMIAKRTEAREKGSWELSDSLRKRLSEEGIAVRDTSYGPIWSRL